MRQSATLTQLLHQTFNSAILRSSESYLRVSHFLLSPCPPASAAHSRVPTSTRWHAVHRHACLRVLARSHTCACRLLHARGARTPRLRERMHLHAHPRSRSRSSYKDACLYTSLPVQASARSPTHLLTHQRMADIQQYPNRQRISMNTRVPYSSLWRPSAPGCSNLALSLGDPCHLKHVSQ